MYTRQIVSLRSHRRSQGDPPFLRSGLLNELKEQYLVSGISLGDAAEVDSQ